MTTKTSLIVVTLFFTLGSCGIIIPKRFTNCCYFQPAANTLYLNCSSERIRKIKIVAATQKDYVIQNRIFAKEFDTGVNKVIIPEILDIHKKNKVIIFYVWYDHYTIQDYSIYVYPKDWINNKTKFGEPSYR